jgi:hypothetical protein
MNITLSNFKALLFTILDGLNKIVGLDHELEHRGYVRELNGVVETERNAKNPKHLHLVFYLMGAVILLAGQALD